MAPEYKLNYFNFRGYGEFIRLIFHYSGVEFEDRRFTHEEWPNLKQETPFGKAPWLEYNGQKLAESGAIGRFLARKYNLAGKDDWEQAQVDSLYDRLKDFGNNDAKPYFMVLLGREQGDKEKLYQDFAQAFDIYAKQIEKFLDSSQSGFLMPSGVTWVDFALTEFGDTLNGFHAELFKDHEKLLKHSEKVHALPQLQEYLKNRPKTPN